MAAVLMEGKKKKKANPHHTHYFGFSTSKLLPYVYRILPYTIFGGHNVSIFSAFEGNLSVHRRLFRGQPL